MENTSIIQEDVEYRKIQGLIGERTLSLILPIGYAKDLGLTKGSYVKVSKKHGGLLIEKA